MCFVKWPSESFVILGTMLASSWKAPDITIVLASFSCFFVHLFFLFSSFFFFFFWRENEKRKKREKWQRTQRNSGANYKNEGPKITRIRALLLPSMCRFRALKRSPVESRWNFVWNSILPVTFRPLARIFGSRPFCPAFLPVHGAFSLGFFEGSG
jgi:hypothetical protein